MEIKVLIEMAIEARKMAYAPYSQFYVGAAVITESGRTFSGCNIESASYSPTNCAERTAIFKAVSEGERVIKAIAVVGGNKELSSPFNDYIPPCGVCRQVIAEFANQETSVILAKSVNDYKIFKLDELFPLSFTKNNL